jgi:hypothetical protein
VIGVLGDDEPTLVHTRRLLIHLVSQHNLRPPRVVPPAPRVPLGPTRGRDTVKREVREQQEKNKDTLLYGPMDEMRRKQML